MSRKGIAFLIAFAMICSFIVIVMEIAPNVEGLTIYVDDDYGSEDPTHKKTIISAIENASNGDTIIVNAGTYYEHVIVNKEVTLIGEDKDTTVIDGSYEGTVIKVEEDNVTISNFTVCHAGNESYYWGRYDAGIAINADNTIIEGCAFTNISKVALLFYDSANYNYLTNNTIFSDSMNAFRCDDIREFHHNYFLNNEITHSTYGIVIDIITGGIFHNNIIEGNTFQSNGTKAFALKNTDGIVIRDNLIDGYEYGLDIDNTHNSIIFHNTINNCSQVGILFSSSTNNKITGNNITNNAKGIYVYSSSNNRIYHNNFIESPCAGTHGFSNIWNYSYPYGGNYWSNYNGTDELNGPNQNVSGKDGIGDTNYTFNYDYIDHYPLMESYLSMGPSAPQDFEASVGELYINLSWGSPLSTGNTPIIKYVIYRCTMSGEEELRIELGNVLYYNDTTFVNNLTYYYGVSAENVDIEGPQSDVLRVMYTIPEQIPLPGDDSENDNKTHSNLDVILIIILIVIIIGILLILILDKKRKED